MVLRRLLGITTLGIMGTSLRLVRARHRMNKAEKYEISSAFVTCVVETVAFPSVVTESRRRQIQDLATDAFEINSAIIGRGIFGDTCYGVDDPVASPIRTECELVKHAVLLLFGQAESPGDDFHDLTRLCIDRLARRDAELVDQLTEERFVHRGINDVNDLQPKRPIDGPACFVPVKLRCSIIGRIDPSADVVLAKL